MEWKKKVLYSDCDANARLSLVSIANIIQDNVTGTFDEMGCDNKTLRKDYHSMWVITKNKIHVNRSPEWLEEITIRCHNAYSTRLTCYLLTEIFDAKGNLIITATTENCVIDIESFRFVKLNTIPFIEAKEEIDITYPIDNEIEKNRLFAEKVKSTMVDYSMHLNNVHSLILCLTGLTLDELKDVSNHSYDFMIKYASQAKYGEDINIKVGKLDNSYCFAVEHIDEKPIVIASLKFN